MICRPHDNGWLLISQQAHAWMAGELVASWGNRQFTPPVPYYAVTLATRLHDIGWLTWDSDPRLGADNRPVNFLDTTLGETIPVWRQAVEWVHLIDPFAALLVSMHASTIYRRRLERAVDPPHEQQLVQKSIKEHQVLQAKLRADLATHPAYDIAKDIQAMEYIYRWLRVADLMSLAVVAGILPKEGKITEVPVGGEPEMGTIAYRSPSPFILEINPWPFDKPEMHVPVQAHCLKQRSFDNQAAYQAAIMQAPWQTLDVEIRPSNN